MAVSRQRKEEDLAKLKDILDKSLSAVFVHFSNLTGHEVTEMRSALKEKGVNYGVFKKTIVKLATQDAKIEGEMPSLDGEIAVAYSSEEETAPAQSIKEFSKKFTDKLSIEGGVFEGKYQNKEQMTEIANIPPLEVLRGMFVNVINSPIQRTAIVLNEIAQTKE